VKIFSGILLVIIFVVALALGSQNQEIVNFNYLIAQGQFSLAMLLGAGFGGGFVLGWFILAFLYLKTKLERNRLMKKVKKQQQEIDKLRAAPAILKNDTEALTANNKK